MHLAEKLASELDRFASTATLPASCPRCGCEGSLRWNGSRFRCASFQVGDTTVYVPRFCLRRVGCGACGTSSTLYPPTVLPRRRYQLCVIEHAVAELLGDSTSTEETVAARHGCVRRTMGRWLRWLGAMDSGALTRELLAVTGEPVLASVSWAQRRIEATFDGSRRWLLSTCAEVLSGLEALASATGRSPPQLVPEFAR